MSCFALFGVSKFWGGSAPLFFLLLLFLGAGQERFVRDWSPRLPWNCTSLSAGAGSRLFNVFFFPLQSERATALEFEAVRCCFFFPPVCVILFFVTGMPLCVRACPPLSHSGAFPELNLLLTSPLVYWFVPSLAFVFRLPCVSAFFDRCHWIVVVVLDGDRRDLRRPRAAQVAT